MTKALSEIAQEKGIRYFLISFTDLFGVQRAKLVPTAAIDSMEANGAGFAGFATGMHATITNHTTPIEMFTNWVGYTSIGIFTGITYPVSFPLLAGYVIYK
jgi:hypothetical protein